jgi:large subunit ribosomal protein L30
MPDQLKVTYVRSTIGRNFKQKRTIKALGFHRLQETRIMADTPPVRGMLNKVIHLLKIEPVVTNEGDPNAE